MELIIFSLFYFILFYFQINLMPVDDKKAKLYWFERI